MKKAPSKAEHDISPELVAPLRRAAAMADEEINTSDADARKLD